MTTSDPRAGDPADDTHVCRTLQGFVFDPAQARRLARMYRRRAAEQRSALPDGRDNDDGACWHRLVEFEGGSGDAQPTSGVTVSGRSEAPLEPELVP